MLAVPGDADLVSEFADLCVRGSAGDSELVDCGVGVRGGGWVPDRDVKCVAVGGRWIAKLEEAVGTNVVG